MERRTRRISSSAKTGKSPNNLPFSCFLCM